MDPSIDHEVVIVGAGLAGIGAGIELTRRDVDDFLILEASTGVGGTWRSHTYPGLTCDIPALYYSFSYEPKSDWSSIWAPQQELLDYCEHSAEKHGLGDHLQFDCRVERADYDERRNAWVLATSAGTVTARYLINCSGYLSSPRLPDIAGLDAFEGTVLHTSAWQPDLDLAGKRVALIGTGATAIQLAPFLAEQSEHLTVFQRTPIWLLPKPALRLGRKTQSALRRVPGLQRAARLAIAGLQDLVFFRVFTNYRQLSWLARAVERTCRWHIRRQVTDPEAQRKLTPAYSWGCKRPSFSNDFYPVFNRDDVELVTEPILAGDEAGLITGRGHRPFDVLVCATGYQPFERGALPTYPVRGRTGRTLDEYWEEHRYQAYRGIAVHGYPNFFLVFGPYSIISTSYIANVEIAARTIAANICAARATGSDHIEVSAAAQAEDHADVLAHKRTSVWNTADCAGSNTFYIDRFGDTPGFRSRYHYREWWRSRWAPRRGFVIGRHTAGSVADATQVPA